MVKYTKNILRKGKVERISTLNGNSNNGNESNDYSITSSNFHSLTPFEKSQLLHGNAEILAPMVRASTTPLRTLALKYGASTVFSEEIIDRSLSINTHRVVNKDLGTIDYLQSESTFSVKQKRQMAKENTIDMSVSATRIQKIVLASIYQ